MCRLTRPHGPRPLLAVQGEVLDLRIIRQVCFYVVYPFIASNFDQICHALEHSIEKNLCRTIRVWNWRTGEEVLRLIGHESRVFRIDFDAKKIISSSQDDTIRIWNFDIDV